MMLGSSISRLSAFTSVALHMAQSGSVPRVDAHVSAPVVDGDLSDDDLEHVVGGLARVRIEDFLSESPGHP